MLTCVKKVINQKHHKWPKSELGVGSDTTLLKLWKSDVNINTYQIIEINLN